MVIDIEEFEAASADGERSTTELIVEFLLDNREAAFTRSEIAESIDRDANTVGTNLSRLKDRGIVRHRRNHWALTDDDRQLAREIRLSRALSGLESELGPTITSETEAAEWDESQPDRPHPSEEETETEANQSDSDVTKEADS